MKRLRTTIIVLIVGAVLSACVSTGSASSTDGETKRDTTAATDGNRAQSGADGGAVRGVDAGSITLPENADPSLIMRDLRPRNGSPLFMGIATRLQNRDEELSAAKLHVAEQASRYVRIRARYQFISQRDANSIGYLDDIDTVWDGDYADSLVESVEVVYQTQDHRGTYILGQVPGIPDAPPLPAIDVTAGREPSWVSSPPSIPGYLVTVGITTPSLRIRDSMNRADQEALKGLLQQAGATVRIVDDLRTEERTGTQTLVTNAIDAEATLRRFYVVARHVSNDQRYFYSLAIAREE